MSETGLSWATGTKQVCLSARAKMRSDLTLFYYVKEMKH